MRKAFLILFFCLGLTSCVLYTPYERASMEIPDSWRVQTSELEAIANVRWWEQFEDPVLDCLIAEALGNNRDLKVAIARVEEFFGLLGVQRSRLFPQLQLDGSAYRQELSLEINPLPEGSGRIFNDFNLLLLLSYELDIWGKIRSANDAAIADLLGQVETRRTVVLTVVTGVASSYIQLLQLDKQLDIARKTWKTREKSLELADWRFHGGLTSELEVKQAASEVESALVEVIRLELLVEEQENLLSVLVGRVPGSIPRGKSLEDFVLPPCVPAGIPSDILDQRPDLLAAEQAIIAANARIGEARALYFPQISLTGFYGGESTELGRLFNGTARTWQYGGNFTAPIFTGGRISSLVEIAKARKSEALYLYESAVLTAFREVDDALIAHQKTLELFEVQRRRVGILKDYLDLATLNHSNGQTDYLNVLDAERNLFRVQLELVQAQSHSFQTLISLYKALGGGWVVDADKLMVMETSFLSESECFE